MQVIDVFLLNRLSGCQTNAQGFVIFLLSHVWVMTLALKDWRGWTNTPVIEPYFHTVCQVRFQYSVDFSSVSSVRPLVWKANALLYARINQIERGLVKYIQILYTNTLILWPCNIYAFNLDQRLSFRFFFAFTCHSEQTFGLERYLPERWVMWPTQRTHMLFLPPSNILVHFHP